MLLKKKGFKQRLSPPKRSVPTARRQQSDKSDSQRAVRSGMVRAIQADKAASARSFEHAEMQRSRTQTARYAVPVSGTSCGEQFIAITAQVYLESSVE